MKATQVKITSAVSKALKAHLQERVNSIGQMLEMYEHELKFLRELQDGLNNSIVNESDHSNDRRR